MNAPFLSTFLYLIFFVILIGFIAYFLKKYNPINSPILLKQRNLRVINRISLTPKSHLYIVCYENKVKLLGVTESNITIIDTLENLTENEIELLNTAPNLGEAFNKLKSNLRKV